MHINYKQVVIWDTSLIDVGFLGSEQSVPLALRGLAFIGVKITTGAPAAIATQWAPSATVYNAVDATLYLMTGTTAAPVWSLVESSASQLATFAYNSDATAGPLTIPAAKMVNAMLDRDGGATDRADVTATAALIVAAIPGAIIGSTFEFVLRNISATAGQKVTLSGGTGVSISGTASIYSGGDITYIGIVTAVGTPAVTIYAEADSSALLPALDVASSVNTIQTTTAAAGNPVLQAAVGSDTNIPVKYDGKGSGRVDINGTGTGIVAFARGGLKAIINGKTLTALGTTQNTTPTAAQLLGGLLTQTSATGAGTAILDNGTNISAGISGVQIGDSFEVMYANLGGGQTVTITGATGSTVIGTAAIPTGKVARMTFVNTGTNTWNVYCTVSA